MIDARVDDAVKQHLQKMDWLRGEEEAQSLTPPPAGAMATAGKMGFNLPLSDAPQTENVIAPLLNAKQESTGTHAPLRTHQWAEGEIPAGQDCRDATRGETSSSDGENKEKGDKGASCPPKDGTPVWVAGPYSEAGAVTLTVCQFLPVGLVTTAGNPAGDKHLKRNFACFYSNTVPSLEESVLNRSEYSRAGLNRGSSV